MASNIPFLTAKENAIMEVHETLQTAWEELLSLEDDTLTEHQQDVCRKVRATLDDCQQQLSDAAFKR